MMKQRTTKRALLSSLLSLMICCAMLIGTTFAWFTDNVTSANNIIKSGNLDVEMYWADGDEDPASVAWKDASSGAIFNNNKWEPGYVEAKHIKIANEGSLALKYKLHIVPNGTVEALADVIDVYYIEGAKQLTRSDIANATPVGTLRDMINEIDGAAHGALLPAGATVTNPAYEKVGEATATIAFKMREDAGNDYMNKSIGTNFSLQLLATQYTCEDDSFDNQYDKDSTYTSLYVEVPDTATDVVLGTEDDALLMVTIPAATVEKLPEEVTELAVRYTDSKVDATNKTVTLDSVEVVDQNGKVVDLEALNNTEKIKVVLPAQTIFEANELVFIYHDGEQVAMTTVNADGTISYEATHFCEVVVTKDVKGGNIDVSTEEEFVTVCGGDMSGKMITLLSDITLSTSVELPAGVILNGNGKQINGSVYAGGDLTIKGHTKVTSFSASYYDRVITIGEGACLEVTGTGRVTLGYGDVFNIIGTIADAKNVNKDNVQPSLIIPGGISITGGNGATMNITNAYVKIGSTSSKNSVANGTFDLNFTNSIAEFTSQFTLSEPTSGKNPTFNMTIKDSVFTTATKLCVAAPNSNIMIDNSEITLGSYIRNSGIITLKNKSVLKGSTIQFGENGGNNGTINVDNSELTVLATSTGCAFDGKGVGKIVLTNNANANITYYMSMSVTCDESSTMTGTELQ